MLAHGGAATTVRHGQIDNPATAERAAEVVIAKDDSIADFHVQGLLAGQVHGGDAAGLDWRTFDEQHSGLGVAGGVVDVDGGVVLQGPGEVFQHGQVHGEPGCGFSHRGVQKPIPALDIVHAAAGNIDSGAIAYRGRGGWFVLNVQTAYTDGIAGGCHDQAVVEFGRSADHGAGHHHATAANGEGAVDGEAEWSVVRGRLRFRCRTFEVLAQVVDAGSGLA